jgi:hypothetical protein
VLDEAVDTPNGALVRRCFRILNAKSIGLTITLADITEEEFRVLELIEAGATSRPQTKTRMPRASKSSGFASYRGGDRNRDGARLCAPVDLVSGLKLAWRSKSVTRLAQFTFVDP